MAITELQVQRFRCLENVDLSVSLEENLIVGPNASGKTSLLESIYFLGHGRSFRGTTIRGLINDQHEDLLLFARLSNPDGKIGVQASKGTVSAKIDGNRASNRSSLVGRLPVQVIEPGIHKLIEEGPDQRRKYLDWGVFHVEHQFYATWRRYRKALDQRNAALRDGLSVAEAAVWEDTLIATGELILQQRLDYLKKLRPFLIEAGNALFDTPLECGFSKGWAADKSLAQAFEDNRQRDRKLARTHAGPHRADIRVRLEDKIARARVSRGQQKLLGAGLVLAQLALFAKEREKSAVLLIDDPAAELDQDSLKRLLAYARQIPAQRFITALDAGLITRSDTSSLFHVEHGVVQKML